MKHIKIDQPRQLTVEPLARSTFLPFGFVVENPSKAGPPTTTPVHASSFPPPTPANQGTAAKFLNISPFINAYSKNPHSKLASSVMNLFVCSPRPLRPSAGDPRQARGVLDITIMERHPFTTQTFSPLGLSPHDTETTYLVVVAPTAPATDMPDLASIKAFMARGSQAVTYGVGTWHAPMIVVGRHDVAFVVTQFVNGVAEDDCQEVGFEAGEVGGVTVVVPSTDSFPFDIGKVPAKL